LTLKDLAYRHHEGVGRGSKIVQHLWSSPEPVIFII
jgi:hypothetical protein